MQVGGPVGIMSLDQDINEYYSRHPLKVGMGNRQCSTMGPKSQVRQVTLLLVMTHVHICCTAKHSSLTPV